MKNEEERLEQLISKKKFNQLTVEEREFVLGMLGSEEEFEAMSKIDKLSGLENLRSTVQPNPELLDVLKSEMRRKKARTFAWPDLFSIKIPAYTAVLLIMMFTSLGFWLRSPLPSVSAIPHSPVAKTDTVIVTRIDTVFREKIVYHQAKISSLAKQVPVFSVPEKQTPIVEGVSMKEKEELNKLLVSGLE